MQTRRDFLRNAAVLTGGAFTWGSTPDAIGRAMAIRPAAGTTFCDAEHVVILMQENRSFDHAFGALQGVRGFRDLRAHILPNGNPVWFQTDAWRQVRQVAHRQAESRPSFHAWPLCAA